MNKNSIIGIILIIGILVGWSIWVTPSKEEIAKQQHYRDSIAQVNRERALEEQKRIAEAQAAQELAVYQFRDKDDKDP